MHKYIMLAIMTMSTGFLFADCSNDDCCNSCNPCGQDCCGDPCSSCNDCCDPCNTCSCSPCCCEPCDFCPPEPPETCAYNAPKFYDLKCCWDMFVTGSFVYAQAKEENLTYAESRLTDSSGTNTVITDSFSTLSYDFEPAFKVGLGFVVGCDNWDFYAEYFRYHASVGSGSFSAPNDTNEVAVRTCWYLNPFSSLAVEDGAGAISANTSWRLNLDSVDFNLRRRYFVGQCLVFQTAVGLRARWIDQKQDTTYQAVSESNGTTTVVVNNSSDSWGIGPRAAIDTEWYFCGAFRFFGNAGMSILYTDYDSIKSNATRDVTDISVPSSESYSSSRDFCFLRPDASIALGLGWGDYWCCNDWFFDLAVSYEFHTLWNQNVLPQLNDCSQDPSSFFGDLYIHGLVITARLDF
jgi:hypothetical protein